MSLVILEISLRDFPSKTRTAIEQIIFEARYLEIVLRSKLMLSSKALRFTLRPPLDFSNVA